MKKEVKAGILVLLAIGLFIYGFNFLKGKDLFSKHRSFYAIYKGVDGLDVSNPVQISGFKVGQVKDIYLYPDNSGRVVVQLYLSNLDFEISDSAVAKIVSSDLLGSKAVELMLKKGSKPAANGDTLRSDTEDDIKSAVDKRIAPLQKKAESLISSIDSVMVVVQAVLDKGTRDNLTKSFETIKKTIETFEKTSLRLDTLVKNEKYKLSVIFSKVESISTTIASNNDKLSNAIRNFSDISDSLAKANIKSTLERTNKTMGEVSDIMEKINKGEGSMGLLINDKKLYRDLDSTSANLDRLLEDMRINPRRYVHVSVFGKKEKQGSKKEVENLKTKVNKLQQENQELKDRLDKMEKK